MNHLVNPVGGGVLGVGGVLGDVGAPMVQSGVFSVPLSPCWRWTERSPMDLGRFFTRLMSPRSCQLEALASLGVVGLGVSNLYREAYEIVLIPDADEVELL